MNRKVFLIGLAIALSLTALLFVSLGNDPRRIPSPLVGQQAPLFTLPEAGSQSPVALAALQGKPVVVNFWATWCRPCHEENPILLAAARMYEGDVQFLGIVFEDDEQMILRFLRENGQAYPTLMDHGGKASIAYGVGGIPETFFIDPTGRIVAKHDGPISMNQMMSYIALASGKAM
jgi:cytochrome c biogenesis protein CcmG, thiol:disulfide interchange protein DsbE